MVHFLSCGRSWQRPWEPDHARHPIVMAALHVGWHVPPQWGPAYLRRCSRTRTVVPIMISVSIVVPVRNEAATIEATLRRLRTEFPRYVHFAHGFPQTGR